MRRTGLNWLMASGLLGAALMLGACDGGPTGPGAPQTMEPGTETNDPTGTQQQVPMDSPYETDQSPDATPAPEDDNRPLPTRP